MAKKPQHINMKNKVKTSPVPYSPFNDMQKGVDSRQLTNKDKLMAKRFREKRAKGK